MTQQKRRTDTPADIAVNLDTLEREGDPGPFPVVVGGKRYELLDAQDLDFRQLIDSQRAMMVGEVERAFECVLAEKDREPFLANRLPMWKLKALFDAYAEHFGMPFGPGGPGESNASS